MKLERDRTKAKIEAIEAQMKAMQVWHTWSTAVFPFTSTEYGHTKYEM